MQRRKFLVGMGSLAAGGAATMSTGALSQLEGERNITGQIVEDSKAYLKLNGSGAADNGFAVEYNNSTGEIRLDFDDNGSTGTGIGGQGVNPDADNWFDHAFRVTNAGTLRLDVYFTTANPRIGFYKGDSPNSRTSVEGSGNSFELTVGESKKIGVYLDTTGLGKNDEGVIFDGDDDFTVYAVES